MVNSKLMRLYEILRHNLILDLENKKENTKKFEEVAKQIDNLDQEEYNQKVKEKIYKTTTLENEKKRLEDLIAFINQRMKDRKELTDDFYNTTGITLTNLEPIDQLESLENYKERLDYIGEYLDNVNQLEKINQEVSELKEQLKRSNQVKELDEKKNRSFEKELLEVFATIISNNPKLKEMGILDKDIEYVNATLNKLVKEAIESKDRLDTYSSCYQALLEAGISGEEKNKYHEYTQLERNDYYEVKEQEYLYNIFKSLMEEQHEYKSVFAKRLDLKQILEERLQLRENLEIETPDLLYNFYLVSNDQYSEIMQQQGNIEAINHLNERIDFDEEKKNILETSNQNVEILSILKEYNMLPVYDEKKKIEEQELELPEDEEKKYSKLTTIIDVKDSLIKEFAYQRAYKVMKKVGKALNIMPIAEEKNIDNAEPLVSLEEVKEELHEEPQEELASDDIFKENVIDPFAESSIEEKKNDIFNEATENDIFINNTEPKVEEELALPNIDESFFDPKEMQELLKNEEAPVEEKQELLTEVDAMDDMPVLPNFGTVHPVAEETIVNELKKGMPDVVFPSLDNQASVPIAGDEYFKEKQSANGFPDLEMVQNETNKSLRKVA